MRQAHLNFAPVSRDTDEVKAAAAAPPTSANQSNSAGASSLFPPVAFPKQTTAAQRKGAAAAEGADQTHVNTPLKRAGSVSSDVSSPPKSTPAFDHSISSSPVSSNGPHSSPLAARTSATSINASSMGRMTAQPASSTLAKRVPTLEDSGFEIVIPVKTAPSKAQSTLATTSADASAAPTVHRPKVTKKKNMTPEEKAEREEKQKEAQLKREAKDQEQKAKQEAKEAQSKQKAEAKEAKEKEAKARQEAKEAKEKELKAKQEAKEEQLRQKAEAREAKEEEQRQKKEAREAKDEEQRAKREAKDAQKQQKEEKARKEAANQAKTRNFMSSFLKKPGASSSSGSSKQATMAAVVAARANAGKSDFQRTFIPGAYKNLAPVNKWKKPVSAELLRVLEGFDKAEAQEEDAPMDDGALSPSQADLMTDFKRRMARKVVKSNSKAKLPATFSSTSASATQDAAQAPSRRGIHPPVVVRQVMRAVAESDIIGGEAAAEAKKALDQIISDRSLVRLKFIQFEQDRRPGWYGSFTRPSNLIGPRRPFAQDPVLLDYSYDSDDEWEDQGQLEGEDIDEGQDAEEEEKEDDDDDSEMDDWLIDDLEEVDDNESTEEDPVAVADKLEDDNSSDIVEVDAEGHEVPASQRKAAHTVPAKRKAVDTDTVVIQRGGQQKRVKALGRRFNAKLVPFSAGPHWEKSAGRIDYALFQPFQVEFLNNASYGLNPFTFDCIPLSDLVSSADTIVMAPPSTAVSKPVPTVCKATGKQTGGPGTLAELFAMANAQDDPLAAPGLPPFPGTAGSAADGSGEKRGRPKGSFPDELLLEFLQIIDGSTRVKPVLVEELKEKFSDRKCAAGPAAVNVSKAAIEKKLNEVAAKDGKGKGSKWVVKGEFRAKYGLPALATPAR
ncbi:hypothetical protein OC834_000300 [Tilletia horrida]|nr:hypothetical protein OC834_000300 [Tilletia horrida]